MYVFVYGTLKRGYGNHALLNRPPLATIIAEMPYKMVSLGYFPALIPSEIEHQITGEVYHIDEEELESLDFLEGYPGFYNRKEMDLHDYGIQDTCWFYYIDTQEDDDWEEVKSGVWI